MRKYKELKSKYHLQVDKAKRKANVYYLMKQDNN